MADLGVVVDGQILDGREVTRTIRDRIGDAKEDRKRLEPTWQENLAFASGKFWLKWDRFQRQLVFPEQIRSKELYTADVVTEYRTTALGELGGEDDRPELLLRRDDQTSEDYQAQLNRALAFGWDHEWYGDNVLEEMRRLVIDLGTAAIRCRWDSTVGKTRESDVPFQNGKPILDMDQATELFSGGPRSDVQMQTIREGGIRWEPLSAFNLLVPPGVPHERDFPWECVVRPVLLSSLVAEYPAAGDLKEDTDISSVMGTDFSGQAADPGYGTGSGKAGRLRDHVWLHTYYERPSAKWPNGRKVVLAGDEMRLLAHEDKLPYEGPNGDFRSGISYFHWWRVTGRFWSRSLVESMKDPQRSINKRRTQTNEIIDRGMPYIIVQEGSNAKRRQGLAMELIEISAGEIQPTPVSGVGPGEWMWRDVDASREDLERATGLRGPRLGENPANVTTYSQLALINENEQLKRQQIRREHQAAIAKLVEDSVYDIRTYWGSEKQIALAGDDDGVDATIFDATKTPPFFIVKVPKGASKPRSQAAELKKVEDIWAAAVASGAITTNPMAWMDWFKESLDAGQALELPDVLSDAQTEKAQLENHAMLQGAQMIPAYYDPIELHVPIHREAQIAAEMSDEPEAVQLIEQHIQMHVEMPAITAQETGVEPGGEQPEQAPTGEDRP